MRVRILIFKIVNTENKKVVDKDWLTFMQEVESKFPWAAS